MIRNALLSEMSQRKAEKGERQEQQPKGQSSTPSGCGRKLFLWSLAQVRRGRTLYDGGFPVGDWLGGQVRNVAFSGKIMADSETQKLERKDFFQRIVEKVDGGGGGFQTVLSERQSESVRFVRIERHVPRVGPVCDFTQICRVRRSCCLLV